MKLQDGEAILHELIPAKNILWIWFFAKALPVGLVGLAVGAAVFVLGEVSGIIVNFEGESDFSFRGGIASAIIFGLGFLLLALVYCEFLRRTYVYYITNYRCVFHGGIIRRVERSVHYDKVTDVEMSQNIIERILDISTLNIFTPGTSSRGSDSSFQKAEISFVGLKDNESPADTINGILRKFRATGK
ncbi:MAG: PH domain-containing protein [Planctomycetota bacterium]|jgi:uncharacterized membrane protein YdbT with pleckstrin-like domain